MSELDKEMIRQVVKDEINQNINENIFQDATRSLVGLGSNLGIVKPVVSIMGQQFQIPAWLFSVATSSFMGIPGTVVIGAGAGMAVFLLDGLLEIMKDKRMRDRYPEYDTVVRDLKAIRQERIKDSDELVKRLTYVLSSIRGFIARVEDDQTIGFFERRKIVKKMHEVYRDMNIRYGSRVMQKVSMAEQ